jgi:hypothetical protein
LHSQSKTAIKRLNYHVVFFGTYIDKQIIDDWWFKNYGSHMTGMELMRDAGRHAYYLSKYLHGEQFVSAYFSKGWVFPGWWGFSRWLKKEFQGFPPKELILEYAKKSREALLKDKWYSLYKFEINGGNKPLNVEPEYSLAEVLIKKYGCIPAKEGFEVINERS